MLRLSLSLLLIPGCLLIALPAGKSQLYYVRPSNIPKSTCPGEPCNTLDFYAKNAHFLLSEKNGSVSMLFLKGIHKLTVKFEVHETFKLLMKGISNDKMLELESTAVINVLTEVNISFTRINELLMANLSVQYLDCNGEPKTNIDAKEIGIFTHQGVILSCCILTVHSASEVNLQYSQYKVDSTVNLTISSNTTQYYPLNSNHSISPAKVSICQCCFLDGRQIYIQQSSQTTPDITVASITYTTGVYIDLSNVYDSFSLLMDNCQGEKEGDGVEVVASIEENSAGKDSFIVTISNSNVTTLYFENMKLLANYKKNHTLQLVNCTFHGGFVLSSNAFSSISLSQTIFLQTTVHLLSPKVCNISNVLFVESLLYIKGPSTVSVEYCEFQSGTPKSWPSPFIVSNVEMFFYGESTFKNNTGYRGGALNMFKSNIYLEKKAKLNFVNNTANDTGGAIYSDNPLSAFSALGNTPQPIKCIISLNYDLDQREKPSSSLYFNGNYAPNGGYDIYGMSLLSDCLISPSGRNKSFEVQAEIFKFNQRDSYFSVSSNPKRVCLCEDENPLCAKFSHIIQERQYAPGEQFNISLALVGDDFGASTGSVFSQSFSSQGVLLNNQYPVIKGVANPNKSCSNVTYVLSSSDRNQNDTLVLLFLASDVVTILETRQKVATVNQSIADYTTKNEIRRNLATTPILLNISLLPCPLGLTLSESKKICRCIEKLLEYGIDRCSIVDGVGIVYRSGTMWVSKADSTAKDVVVYRYCPYGYCTMEETAVNLKEPDSQCALNHHGVLCGECKKTLSLALGSSQCLPCSDDGHLAILLAFLAAGPALICFIKLLDFTITSGAINGLIFYANILWTSQSIFFPYTSEHSWVPFQFLKIFVAWINLDLGIQTCFIRGLDMYWKTWLQFLFPLYIWGLAGLIILACHFSPKVTKIFGSNSVPLLATMFLLSYSKLLRTIITCLGFALLHYPEEVKIVWLADGNVPYFGLRHSFLFIIALLFLIVFWLPYTVTIMLVPCLRKNGNFSWVNKLKPFYDAHFGPLKDKYQYWIGITLLLRVVLAISGVAVHALDPTVNILLTVVLASLIGFIVSAVYKKWFLSFLEASFLINLIILCCGFLYSHDKNIRLILTSISVGIAFLTFLALVCIQGYRRIKLIKTCYKAAVRHEGYENLNESEATQRCPTHSVVSTENIQTLELSQEYQSSGYREPLLNNEM